MTWVSVVWVPRACGRDVAQAVRDEVGRRCSVAGDSVRLTRLCPSCGSDRHGRLLVAPSSELAPPSVSLSRSPDLSVAVVASGASVGVDVEEVASFARPGLCDVVLHRHERAQLPGELATTWVRKEALLKAAGCGLTMDPSSIRVSGPREPASVLSWPQDPWAAEPGWVRDLDVTPGLRAAVAGSGPAPEEVLIRTLGAEEPLG